MHLTARSSGGVGKDKHSREPCCEKMCGICPYNIQTLWAIDPSPACKSVHVFHLLMARESASLPAVVGACLSVARYSVDSSTAGWFCGARQHDTQYSNSLQHWLAPHLQQEAAVDVHFPGQGKGRRGTHVWHECCSPLLQQPVA